MDTTTGQASTLLIAEDDDEDYELLLEALKETGYRGSILRVSNGADLMDFLTSLGKDAPLPTLLLLDLNMPKKGGCEALRAIKSHPELNALPVVVLSGCGAAAYILDANSVVKKPGSYDEMTELAKSLQRFWGAGR